MSGRKWTTRSLISAVVLAVLLGVAGTAIAHDARLDLASLDLEKARLLLQASDDQVPQVDAKTEKAYSRMLRKAIDAIIEAEQHVQDAAAVADAP